MLALGVISPLGVRGADQPAIASYGQGESSQQSSMVTDVNIEGVATRRKGGKEKPLRHQLHRTPTATQKARWEAVQYAKKQGLSLRAISRTLGIAKNTVKKYMSAESPPTKKLSAKERAKAEALAASLMATD